MMKRLIIILSMLLSAGIASARTVTGVVKSGRHKLEGVIVTDGINVTVTDRKGTFSLDTASDAEFVYITVPTGYAPPIIDGVPHFFSKLDESVGNIVFELNPYGNGKDYAVIALADPQTKTLEHFDRFQSETEPDIVSLIEAYKKDGIASVGLYLGDIAWDELDIFRNYKEHMARLGIPVYNTIGNHDYDMTLVGDKETSSAFRKNFGPLYYGFNVGEKYFIVLDNIVYDTAKKYVEKIDTRQYEWLKMYSEHIPVGAHVYVAMHAPFMKYFNGNEIMEDGEQLLDIFRNHKLALVTGHSHNNSNLEVAPGVIEHNVVSAGGSWWMGHFSKDGSPNGYRVFEISGENVSWYYKTTGEDRDYQFRFYDRGSFDENPEAVVAKIWDWDSQWKVNWYQDGKYMGEMQQFWADDPDYIAEMEPAIMAGKATRKQFDGFRKPITSYFYFAAIPDPGARKIEVVVTDRFGKVYRGQKEVNAGNSK